jgi:hypothetical protein
MANKANLANSVLFAPLSDSDTELEVYTGDGSLFPAVPFYLTISPKNKWSRKINTEIVLVTAKSSNTFTITRAQKGTTAKNFDYGDLVANGIYKEDLDDVLTAASAASDSAIATAIAAAKQALMPVGFVVTLGVSTDPATLFGFGTWTRIQGRVVVGVSDTDHDFDLNDTGGEKAHLLTVDEMPSHRHTTVDRVMVWDAGRSGAAAGSGFGAQWYGWGDGSWMNYTGGSQSHNNMQPYISKYVWERTA